MTMPAVKGLFSPERCPSAFSASATSASVWVSRSRSNALTVSGRVWRACQDVGGIATGEAAGLATAQTHVHVNRQKRELPPGPRMKRMPHADSSLITYRIKRS
ncbi:hypothetical protein LAUMK191_02639 [Mycobacterium attenuatum]|nr:hypothetical protein LAUMK191_02639 [Mycobacterium attenuatum]